MYRQFRIPILVSALILALTLLLGGITAFLTVAILGLLEITFSFDNAIVNAKILKRMNPKWQRLFLTVGILIAVFGMRLLFPLIIVSISAHLDPLTALRLAITNPNEYAHHITAAHVTIAAFGGTFLLMLFLDWLFEERGIYWLKPERLLNKFGQLSGLTIMITLAILLLLASMFGHQITIFTAGIVGAVTYLIVTSLDNFFNEKHAIAKAGLATFLYLEVLDASFSFDGVIGAFAVTNNIFFVGLGLGIGAMFIRGLTVYLTNKGTLSDYRYLEHGAHWAIGILAVLLLLTIKYDIPDVIIGLIGLLLIGSSFISSLIINKRAKNNVI